jgi:hypothetical protein
VQDIPEGEGAANKSKKQAATAARERFVHLEEKERMSSI